MSARPCPGPAEESVAVVRDALEDFWDDPKLREAALAALEDLKRLLQQRGEDVAKLSTANAALEQQLQQATQSLVRERVLRRDAEHNWSQTQTRAVRAEEALRALADFLTKNAPEEWDGGDLGYECGGLVSIAREALAGGGET